MREAVGAPLLSVWLPLLFTLDLRRGLCRLWEHMLLTHTQSLSHTHIHKHVLALFTLVEWPALCCAAQTGDYRSSDHNSMLAICFALISNIQHRPVLTNIIPLMVTHTVSNFYQRVTHQSLCVSVCERTIWFTALIQIHTVDDGWKQNCFSEAAPLQPVFYADYFLICA